MVKGLGAEEVINYKEQNFAGYDGKIDGFVELATPGTYEGAKQILKENAPYVTIGKHPCFNSHQKKSIKFQKFH